MGVMRCERGDCDNILCDRLVLDGTKYICWSCYAELVDLKATWEPPMTEDDIRDAIVGFMETNPGATRASQPADIDEAFERLTGG